MWWSVKNGLSKSETDHASAGETDPSFSIPKPLTTKHTSSDSLNRMMQAIDSDISGTYRQEKEKIMTELAQRARALCLNDISHDLRTPLNAIIGFAQMMENGALGQIENPQYIEYLRHIRESGYDLLGKVEDLMDGEPQDDASSDPTYPPVMAKLEEAVA